MIMMGVIGIVLLIGGLYMLLVSKGSAQIQIGGLLMVVLAIASFTEVRFIGLEQRLRKLEGKPTD